MSDSDWKHDEEIEVVNGGIWEEMREAAVEQNDDQAGQDK